MSLCALVVSASAVTTFGVTALPFVGNQLTPLTFIHFVLGFCRFGVSFPLYFMEHGDDDDDDDDDDTTGIANFVGVKYYYR